MKYFALFAALSIIGCDSGPAAAPSMTPPPEESAAADCTAAASAATVAEMNREAVAAAAAQAASGPAACNTFISVVCGRLTDCAIEESGPGVSIDRASYVSACKGSWAAAVDCSKSLGTGPSIDLCLTSLSEAECTAVYPNGQTNLPAACNGAILVP